MSILNNSIIPASAGGYEIDNSLRFNDDDSAYLSWTPSSAGNRKTWTWSGWVKLGDFSGNARLFNVDDEQYLAGTTLMVYSDRSLVFIQEDSGVYYQAKTYWSKYRDPSAWYHIVLSVDTTQVDANDKIKIFINGDSVPLDHSGSLSLNYETRCNNIVEHNLCAKQVYGTHEYFDGLLAEVNFIDGQALTPSSFGETDATYGHWKPIEYTGTYGTNGFYLNFAGGGIMSATGGTITTDGDYKVHSFTADGTFTPSADGYVEYLVIAGGGAGGSGREYNIIGGGGGAGGYLTGMYQVTQDTDYAIVVGAGGAGVATSTQNNGSDSTGFGLTAVGGGAGGTYNSKGNDGGSGGGTGLRSSGQDLTGGAATSGQGNAGGSGTLFGGTGTANSGGGGGGAGAAGSNGSGGTGGNGGAGLANSITGSSVTRAGGGGGGGRSSAGSAGSGGAGAGSTGGGANASANTGSGGGGSTHSHPGSESAGGDGGSGIVIVRYKFQ